MTRQIILLTLVFTLVFSSNIIGQTNKITNYKIEIKQWGLLTVGDCYWSITFDSIKVKWENIGYPSYNYSKALTSAESLTIIEALKKVKLKRKKDDYVDNSVGDDMGEYDFEILFYGQTKVFHVYQVKLDDIFYLVKKINELLPYSHQIGYNDEYFRIKN